MARRLQMTLTLTERQQEQLRLLARGSSESMSAWLCRRIDSAWSECFGLASPHEVKGLYPQAGERARITNADGRSRRAYL